MQSQNLEGIANALVADRKGILAADETIGTLTKRFEKLKIRSTPESRRDYRELLFATPGAAEFSAVSSCTMKRSVKIHAGGASRHPR